MQIWINISQKRLFSRPTTRTTKTISSASDSLRSSILTSNERSLRENGDVYTYVNFQPEILNCELVTLFMLKQVYQLMTGSPFDIWWQGRQGSNGSPCTFHFSPTLEDTDQVAFTQKGTPRRNIETVSYENKVLMLPIHWRNWSTLTEANFSGMWEELSVTNHWQLDNTDWHSPDKK